MYNKEHTPIEIQPWFLDLLALDCFSRRCDFENYISKSILIAFAKLFFYLILHYEYCKMFSTW